LDKGFSPVVVESGNIVKGALRTEWEKERLGGEAGKSENFSVAEGRGSSSRKRSLGIVNKGC